MDKFETAIRFAGELDDIQTAALRFELADVYLRLGRIAQALRESEKSLKSPELDPENEVRILLWRSQIHISQERLNSAAQEMERASKLPAPAALKSRISEISAQISMSRKDPGKAAAQLQDAINLRNNEPDHELQLKLAKALNAAEQPHQALRIINRLREEQATLTFHPAEIDLCEAEAFRMQKKIVKSLECYLKIIESEPENQPVYQQARQAVHRLKKQLETEPGRRYFKIDGPDRKALASLLARSPGDDVMSRLKRGLAKTKSSLVGNIEKLLGERKDITSEILDDLEELLLLSDIGVTTTMRIMNGLRDKLRKNEIRDACFVRGFIRSEIESILNYGSIDTLWEDHDPPHIIMVVGVNGVGKTTTIAKLARHYRDQGKTVFLAAGDTFRAGAIQQLQEWGKRVNAEVISQAEGSDPSAVAWDAVAAAKSRHADILIIDTAGRLHTQFNLMEELKKVHRVVGKNMPGAPHEILLVLDATTGQNAVAQARLFSEAVRVTGIALTKLDGTAKGGIVISIVNDLKLPVRYIGIGERMDDLRDFDPRTFAAALFED
ncbi:signal recognition particle-docking protein FtsY [bacterium]|nr:signal recognition particle-docking protein FtsY [candidate division CSSED10-310 bacterium]